MTEGMLLPENLVFAIKKAEVVTFDIFDTALLRATEKPTDLFLLAAYHAKLDNPSDFVKARIEAERKARNFARRNNNSQEVTLQEIYFHVMDLFLNKTIDLQKVLEMERHLEYVVSRRNPITGQAYALAKAQGKQVGFISDIYLDKPLIASMLEKCGFQGYDFIHLSSETKLTKASGTLFRYVLERQHITPYRQLHIGDNLHSDIRQAKRLGLHTHHISKASDILKRSHIGKRLKAQRSSISQTKAGPAKVASYNADIWISLWRGLVAAQQLRPSRGIWFDLGYTHIGMLLLGFAAWINRSARLNGLDHLYFLARDGHVMLKIHEILESQGLAYCKGSYLYASRRALNIPALHVIDDAAIDFLLSGTHRFRLTVAGFLTRAGLTPDKLEHHVNAAGFTNMNQLVDSAEDYARMRHVFRNAESDLLQLASEERRILKKYWRGEGIFDKSNIGVVDIGWHGTLQDAFQRLCRSFEFTPRLTGYYFGTFPAASSSTEAGAHHRGYICEAGKPAINLAIIKRSVEIFEWIFSAPHGSVIGFKHHADGSIAPILDSTEQNTHAESMAGQVQSGSISFIEDALECFRGIQELPPIPPELAISMLGELLSHPTRHEAQILGDLPHREGFGGHGEFRTIAPATSGLSNPLNWPRLIQGYRQAYWRRGYLSRLGL